MPWRPARTQLPPGADRPRGRDRAGKLRLGDDRRIPPPADAFRDYRLRGGGRDLGRLRFAPGRRSVALAVTGQTGALVLTAGPGGVEVRRRDDGATVATVQRARRGVALIRIAQGPPLGWRRSGRWHRWAIGDGGADLLHVGAAQGLLRSWVRITVQRDQPAPEAVLLGVIGGFLALRELQAETDAAAAVGGIVAATGAG